MPFMTKQYGIEEDDLAVGALRGNSPEPRALEQIQSRITNLTNDVLVQAELLGTLANKLFGNQNFPQGPKQEPVQGPIGMINQIHDELDTLDKALSALQGQVNRFNEL